MKKLWMGPVVPRYVLIQNLLNGFYPFVDYQPKVAGGACLLIRRGDGTYLTECLDSSITKLPLCKLITYILELEGGAK